MDFDYHQLPHPGIKTLKPYVPGKSIEEVTCELGIKNIIKLASNENPLGCSPKVLETLASLPAETLARYPAPLIHPLRKKLAKKLSVDESMVFLGNGSDLLFSLLLTIFALNQDKHMLTHDYAFSTYAISAHTLGIPVKSTRITTEWQVDINALIQATTAKTALIFIANPNNPTGVFIPLEQIERLLKSIAKSTILVMDEAYYEFAYPKNHPGSLSLLAKFPNLVVTRTFSKAYGLAGLRLGYAIAKPEIIELMQRVQLPFIVNQVALSAGSTALDDIDFLDETIENNNKGLIQLQNGLDNIGLSHIPSSGNFISFNCGRPALAIYEYLLHEGVIVRPLSPYQLPDYLRVTIGKPLQNAYFLDILKNYYNQK